MGPAVRPRGYSALQITLHWVIAALVLFQLVVNEGMQDAFDDRIDGDIVRDEGAALLHVVVGLLVLGLAAVRLAIRLRRGAPGPHETTPAILNWLGTIVHWLLYLFIFAMPLTGALAWFGGLEFSAELHELGRLILVPAIGLHIIGALVEQFVLRNDGLMRMLRPRAD